MERGYGLHLLCQYFGCNICQVLTLGASFYRSCLESLFSPYLWFSMSALAILPQCEVWISVQANSVSSSLSTRFYKLGRWGLVCDFVSKGSGDLDEKGDRKKEWCLSVLVSIVTVELWLGSSWFLRLCFFLWSQL